VWRSRGERIGLRFGAALGVTVKAVTATLGKSGHGRSRCGSARLGMAWTGGHGDAALDESRLGWVGRCGQGWERSDLARLGVAGPHSASRGGLGGARRDPARLGAAGYGGRGDAAVGVNAPAARLLSSRHG
jgi:hypothetical protein